MKTKTSKRNHNDTDNFLYEDWPEPAKSSDLDSSDASSEKVSKKSKKRKKKRDSSSDSDSDQSEKHSHKKRKHKKKKKKHSKKKRHVSSDDSDSESDNDPSSEISEEDSPPVKRKHKHKHKHSSKRKPENEKSYTETATVRPDERDVKTHKLKSICKEKEPFKSYHNASVEHVISSDEENDDKYSKSKRDVEYTKRSHHSNHIKIEISPEGTSSKHHSRLPRVEPPEPDSSHDQYYNKNSSGNRSHRYNSQGESFGQPQQKFDSERDRDRYDADKLSNQQPYFNNGRHNDSFHKYRDNRNYKNDGNDFYNEHDNQRRQSFDGRYQNNTKFEDRRVHNDRYQGNSFNRGPDHSQGERFVDHRQGNSSFNRRPQNNNYQQQHPYNRDNNRQDGGYQRNKDYQHRNEHGGNRYQDKNDFPSTSQQFGRRYDDRNVNERKNSSKEDSLPDSTSREMRDDRSGTRKRTELSDHKPDTDREDREESATRRKKFMRREKSEEKDSYEWGKKSGNDAAAVKTESNANDKEKPNFGLSGKLTEDTNMVNGVVIKYSEPPEARQPKRRWRFYPFKGDKALPILYIHRQSCFLLGRDRKVTDIPLDHPSISKQHAALQYRLVPFTRDDGSTGKRVRPYIIDLGSANGTFVNNKQIESSKYVELLEKDVVKFGFSQREYVLLHENSKEEGMDDDDVNIAAGSDDTKPATATTAKTSIKREN